MVKATVILSVDRASVRAGEAVNVSGVVRGVDGRWIPRALVDIYANNSYVATTRTDNLGRFSQRISLPRTGRYIFTAYFRGGSFSGSL